MTIKECYEAFHGDYDGVCIRINSGLLGRLLKMFPADPSMGELREAVAQGDCQAAFRAVHTLKGVALNMGFSDLAEASSALTEKLRGGVFDDFEQDYVDTCAQYERVLEVLSELEE